MRSTERSGAVAMLAAVAALAVAGCGEEENQGGAPPPAEKKPAEKPTPAGGGQTLKLSADPGGQLAFDKEKLTARAGRVTLVMDNPSQLPHAVSIKGNGVHEDGNTVMKGGTSRVTATLEKGTYEFYCPVQGHEAAGMQGTLIVR